MLQQPIPDRAVISKKRSSKMRDHRKWAKILKEHLQRLMHQKSEGAHKFMLVVTLAMESRRSMSASHARILLVEAMVMRSAPSVTLAT